MELVVILPRLFVALSLPGKITDALSVLQHGVESARWCPVENLHLTLSFMGELDCYGLRTAINILADIQAPSFDLKLSGTGSFGNRIPRAIWAGITPSPRLIHLQKKSMSH